MGIDFSEFSPATLIWAADSVGVWVTAAKNLAAGEAEAGTYLDRVKAAEAPLESVAATLDKCPLLMSADKEVQTSDRQTAELQVQQHFDSHLKANVFGDGELLKEILSEIKPSGTPAGTIGTILTVLKIVQGALGLVAAAGS